MRLLLLVACLLGGLFPLASSEECTTNEWKCANGQCINILFKCDGSDDCPDGSDEIGCPAKTCSQDEFRCNDGKCITNIWVCDGSADCDDKHDESAEICGDKSCAADEFKCTNSKCIPKEWVCDADPNCPGGEDEKDCKKECPVDEFQCADGTCIAQGWHCDDSEDCEDGSDELNCTNTCSADKKMCSDGECLDKDWFCDGRADCKDGSDEKNCTESNDLVNDECSASSFQCVTPQRNRCIGLMWRCDGDVDCEDGSDEEGCEPQTCPVGERSCGNGANYCINEKFFCDGDPDCTNGGDELNCNLKDTKCLDDEFNCGNGKCIKDNLICNGFDDCGNSEDESLDRKCPKTNTCLVENGGCAQLCVVDGTNPKGRRCECRPGFAPMENSETGCEDINECNIAASCSQTCTNTKGSYKCGCVQGYQLVDQRFCKATSHHEAELILTSRHEIRRYNLSSKHYSLLLGNDNVVGGRAMDIDVRNNKIYFADTQMPGTIYIGDLKSKQHSVFIDSVKEPEGLALDWVHGNLYLTDKSANHIQVVQIKNKMRKTLLSNLSEPSDIAVDPYLGWIFWTRWGDIPAIERSGMNGAHRETIITEDMTWPTGLTIDYFAGRLYWVDSKLHTISSAKMDGSDQHRILKSHHQLAHPLGITIFEDYLFWTDQLGNNVKKTSKFGTDDVFNVATGIRHPMGIRVMHLTRQPINTNRCENNGGCSHFCLPVPVMDPAQLSDMRRNFDCACPDGLILDGKFICRSPSDVVIPVEKPEDKAVVIVPAGKSDGDATEHPEYTTGEGDGDKSGVTQETGVGAAQKDGKGEGHVAIIAIAVVAVIALAVGAVIFLVVRKYKKRNVKSMNFDNPVYRKTTTDDKLIMDSSSNLPQPFFFSSEYAALE